MVEFINLVKMARGEMIASERYLDEARAMISGDSDDSFRHAVDSYGDARKHIEDLETEYFRERIGRDVPAERYDLIRGGLIERAERLHTEISKFKKLRDGQKVKPLEEVA